MRIADLPAHLRPAARAALDVALAAPAGFGGASLEPMHLVIPYVVLVPDNARSRVTDGRAFLSRRYRAAKEALRSLATAQIRGRAPLAGDVVLVARVWVPDRRRRDLLNLGKLLGDALAGVCFLDDAQIADVRFVRTGLDRDHPRAELTISPRSEGTSGATGAVALTTPESLPE